MAQKGPFIISIHYAHRESHSWARIREGKKRWMHFFRLDEKGGRKLTYLLTFMYLQHHIHWIYTTLCTYLLRKCVEKKTYIEIAVYLHLYLFRRKGRIEHTTWIRNALICSWVSSTLYHLYKHKSCTDYSRVVGKFQRLEQRDQSSWQNPGTDCYCRGNYGGHAKLRVTPFLLSTLCNCPKCPKRNHR